MRNFTENIHLNNVKAETFVKLYSLHKGHLPFIFENYVILPGFCDVHVHFREPGFSYKETIKTGSLAAAKGGYTSVFTMPNLNPVPDSSENIKKQIEIIEKDSKINIIPYGSITKKESGQELSDMEELSPYVCGFSDDGRGVQNLEIMKQAMIKAKKLGKIISAHCEDNSLLFGGYIHDGVYAKANGHRGISSESEYAQVKRDITLAKETGVSYHVCHISTKESVALIKQAKSEGIDITCETAPHYLILCDENIKEDGRFKMNPPLRDKTDREALINGIKDGTVDMIATDHAPHSSEEKSRGHEKSLFGITGLETAFPILYTELVRTGVITLEKLTDLLSVNPKKRFGINDDESFTVFEISEPYKINPEEFLSMGKSTPFDGKEVFGKCILTVCGGKTVWQENSIKK